MARTKHILSLTIGVVIAVGMVGLAGAEDAPEKKSSVELNGDVVEYSVDGNVVTASGHVVVNHPQATLSCDEVTFDRLANVASAKGNVRLVTEQGEITADALTFDFNSMTGDFHNAHIYAEPYYGAARKVSRVSESKIVMEDGYVTTSDFDKPEYRVVSSRIEVYPKDKVVAKHNRLKVGPVPLAYMPRYTQSLKVKEPRFQFTPGYDKDWGIFLLTTMRYHVSENFKGNLHLDVRELLGVSYGADLDYNTQRFGKGVLKTYYTSQERLTSQRVGEDEPLPDYDGEDRYKAEWRHRWKIDEKTDMTLQFYKISDADFLRNYFEREFDEDQSPPTFFVLTRALPKGVMSLRSDVRVNDFVATTERKPELRYDLRNQEIGETGLYYSHFSTATSLSKVEADPSTVRTDTNRVHIDQQLSYPFKLAFFELNPFVGSELTYYSRARDREEDGNIREYYKAGASLQTKFYRIYDVDATFLGEEIDRMRHIITPSLTYTTSTKPTIADAQLEQIDAIDTRSKTDVVNVALENKWQLKRDGTSVDFMRSIISSDYHLKTDGTAGEGFETIKTDLDLRPTDWLRFFLDSEFDLEQDRFDTSNFDMYINSGSKWEVGLGRRFHADVDDQITTHFKYVFNPKWRFRMLQRFNIDDAEVEEQQYVLTRDLHSWEMDFLIDDDEEGSEFVVIFRLKAFPEIGFDFGTSFNERESGSEPEKDL